MGSYDNVGIRQVKEGIGSFKWHGRIRCLGREKWVDKSMAQRYWFIYVLNTEVRIAIS